MAAQHKLLLIDDDELTLLLMKKYFEDNGITTLIASSKSAALTILQAHPIHCILLDYNMPPINGLEMATAIRTNDFSNQIPIIVLSATVTDTMINNFKSIGINQCISKKISNSELLRLVLLAFGNGSECDTATNHEITLKQVSFSYIKDRDIETSLHELHAKSPQFLDTLHLLMLELTNAHQSLTTFLTQSNTACYPTMTLHKLKGISANIKLSQLGDLIEQAENTVSLEKITPIVSLIHQLLSNLSQVKTHFHATYPEHSPPPQDTKNQIKIIKEMLTTQDIEALDLIAQLITYVRDPSILTALKKAESQLAEFNFVTAKNILDNI